MIFPCPRCGQKNRLPDPPRSDGNYRCGRCRTLLDPLATAVPDEETRPAKRRRPPVWLRFLTGLAALPLLLLTIANLVGPERWWFTSFNLYMPQWVWGIPLPLLLLLYALFAVRWIGVPIALILWVAGPLMGFTWGWPQSPPPDALRLRVMTYNVKWGERDETRLAEEVIRHNPDLLLMQDSAGVLQKKLGKALAGWNIRESGQYIAASRLPLSELEWIDISFPNSNHHATRGTVTVDGVPLAFITAHLLSPRYGLVSVRRREIDGLKRNTESRLIEAERLAERIGQENGPVIVAGDFNAPQQGLVCRTIERAGVRDAFRAAGFGYGYTYGRATKARHSYVRIDHIFVSDHWGIARCFAGTDLASDHCPVIADIFLRRP
ncbi:MAG: endonuclease/exonuclease/phosphatase family protein [Capsulimonadales bacterium]|nr:endonuclease/exonuclease/phosphatase family protein [Capsulimonadales bacterium]